MCRNRAVGVRRAPRPSATSWPWAQYSISRAVANDGGLIGGPYQGTLVPAGTKANASTIASNPRCQPSISWVRDRWRRAVSWPVRKPSTS